jgi:hypothetical protein
LQVYEFDAQTCSLLAWALARMHVRVPRAWLEMLMVAIYEQGMDGWGPQVMNCSCQHTCQTAMQASIAVGHCAHVLVQSIAHLHGALQMFSRHS